MSDKKERRIPKVRDNPHTEENALEKVKPLYPGMKFRKKGDDAYEVLDSEGKVVAMLDIRRCGDVVTIASRSAKKAE